MNSTLIWLIGPYVIWCLIALPLWLWLRRRMARRWARALVFSMLFAPGFIMVIYQAGFIGPAALGLLVFAVLSLMAAVQGVGNFGGEFTSYVLYWLLLPGAATLLAYAGVDMLRARLRHRLGPSLPHPADAPSKTDSNPPCS